MKNTPSLPAGIDRQLRTTIEKLAEANDTGAGLRGRPEDRYIRVADLLDMGLARKLGSGAQRLVSGENLVPGGMPNMTIPPVPEGLEVNGGIGIIFLTWRSAKELYGNHSSTEVWRAEVDNIGSAIMVGETAYTFIFVDGDVDYTKTYYYWIRFVSDENVIGPWNSSVGTIGRCEQDPGELLDLLSGEIRSSQLHQSLREPIELINAPNTGLVAQLQSQAASQLALARQLRGDYEGSDPSQITTGLFHAQQVETGAAINQLASQMALLSAGSANQFDHVNLWYFDSGIEGWESNGGSPAVTSPGWIRPAYSTFTTLGSPAISVDGTKYTQIRARVRKVGSPAWYGAAIYATPAYPTLGSGGEVTIPAPEFEDGVANITFNMGEQLNWVGNTVTRVLLILGAVTDSANYYEVDWIAIGRPAPGASSAELLRVDQARITGDSANAQAIALANTQIAGKASQSALDSLSSTVSTQGGAITAQNAKLAALDSQLYPRAINKNGSFVDWPEGQTYPTGYYDWVSNGYSKYTGQYAYTTNAVRFNVGAVDAGIRQDVTGIADPELLEIELVFTRLAGPLSGAGLHLAWHNTAGTGYTANCLLIDVYKTAAEVEQLAYKKTVATFSVKRPAGFQGTFNYLTFWLMGNYYELGALTAKDIIFDRVTISVADANAKATDLLTTRVAETENGLVSQSSKTTLLENSLAAGGANICNNDSFELGVDGTQGWGIYNNAGVSSTWVWAPGRLTGKSAKIVFNAASSSTQGVFSYSGQNVIFKANKWYTVSFYAKKENGASFTKCSLEHNIAPEKVELLNPTLTTDWQRYAWKMRFTQDVGELYLNRLGSSVAGDAIFFDDVMVTEGEIVRGYMPKSDYAQVAATSAALESLDSRVENTEEGVEAVANKTLQLQASMPGGGNLIPTDTEFASVPTATELAANIISGWELGYNDTGAAVRFKRNEWCGITPPTQTNALVIDSAGATTGDFSCGIRVPVIAGKRYCFSAWLSAWRSKGSLFILWHNSANQWFATDNSAGVINNSAQGELTNWYRDSFFTVAPAGAVSAILLAFCTVNPAWGTQPYLFMARPMFSEVPATTTQEPPYSPSSGAATTAAIKVTAEAAASQAAGAVARWEVKTTVGDLTGGVGFYNDGIKTRFAIHADQFSVYSPGADSFGLIVEGSKVVMDGASIKNASITSASITNLDVTKIIGNTASFVKANVGTLVVDDIQGEVSAIYALSNVTSPFDFAGQVNVGNITIPARANNRPYGLLFSVQGIAIKATAGSANIVAAFFEQNANPSIAGTIATPVAASCRCTTSEISAIAEVYSQSTTPPANPTPADWVNIAVGDVVTAYVSEGALIEGVVADKIPINSSNAAGYGYYTYQVGTRLVLSEVVALGVVRYDGVGVTLQKRTQSGRLYRRIGITLSQTVYTVNANTEIRYNMSMYDTTPRLSTGRTLLCTIGHQGTGACTNTLVNFAALAGR